MKKLARRSTRYFADRLFRKKGVPAPAKPRRSLFQHLELLDDRIVPAVINVNSTADLLTPPPGIVTLRAAIQQANATPGGNTINLTKPGLYQITIPPAQPDDTPATENNATGDFDILPTGGNLTIQNTSGGAVAVSGNGLDRVLDINPNFDPANPTPKFTVTLMGFTIENGVASPGDGATGSGGGIRDQGNASLTLTNMALINNVATADGGGVAMENAVSTPWTLTLNNTTVQNNHAGDAGGGVETDGSGKIFINPGTRILNNTCLNQGAGIWLDAIGVTGNNVTTFQGANLTIDGAQINNNQGLTANCFGGGIGNAGNGAVNITDTIVDNNFSGGVGGGFADENNQGTLTVLNSVFNGNSTAGNGGGIQEGGATTTVINSEINNNGAGAAGGGIFANGTQLNVQNSSIINNTSTMGGGGIELQTTGTGAAGSSITNSTINFNKAINNGFANGGGIEAPATFTGSLSLFNDTLEHNFASMGGGVFYAGTAGSTFSVENTVMAANSANTGPDANNPAGAFTDAGGNLIGVSGTGGGNTGFTSPNTRTGTLANPLTPGLTLRNGQLSAVTGGTSSVVFSISPAGFIYRSDATGSVKIGDGGKQLSAWTDASGNAVAFVVTTNNALARYDSTAGWQVIGGAGSIQSVSAGRDAGGKADAFVITTGGGIFEFRGSSGWTGLPSMPNNQTPVQLSAVDQDRVVVLTGDHSVWEHDPQFGWYPLTSPGFAQSISTTTNQADQVVTFAETLDQGLFIHTNTSGWSRIGGAGSIAQISAGTDATGQPDVYVITTHNDVLRFDLTTGWSLVTLPDSPVTQISATAADRVFAVFGDGSLDSFDPANGVTNIAGPGFAMV